MRSVIPFAFALVLVTLSSFMRADTAAQSSQVDSPQAVVATRSMTNEDVIALCKAGLADDVVIQAIKSAKLNQFHLDPQELLILAQAGASSAVIREMQRVSTSGSPTLMQSKTAFLVNRAIGSRAVQHFNDLKGDL
jgi:hypothetical protein